MPIDAEYEPGTWKLAADHVERYESSGGTRGLTMSGAPCVVLTTLGRRSGKARKAPVIRVEHDGRYEVLASMGGQPQHPGWYFNLVDDPHVTLQDGPVVRDYVARPLEGAERDEWWARATEVWPAYDDYQAKTTRVIPVVLLDPA